MNKGIFIENVWRSNPIFMQVLGICSALAVTNLLTNTFTMTIGVTVTTGLSSLTVSIFKSLIPRRVRMIIQVLIISFYVIIVDLLLQTFFPDISKSLGPYVGLIITNCIIMGRAEACAISSPPGTALWDGLTAGFGYMAVLMCIAFFRELLGFGTLFGIRIIPAEIFLPWTIMVTPPSAFFLLGIIIWIVKPILKKQGVEV